MIKIGVIGAGNQGKTHMRVLKELNQFNLVGFYDIDSATAKSVSTDFGVKSFSNSNDLINACDAIDIVTPTLFHHNYAAAALKKSKHVFIEKPIGSTLKDVKHLVSLSYEANVKIQIGYEERLNPAFVAAKTYLRNPTYIEMYRLTRFNSTISHPSIVLDLMIYDLDILLNMVNSPIKKISASGVPIISASPDVCNARIEFYNGCVANLTSNRVATKDRCTTSCFQKEAIITVNFLKSTLNISKPKHKKNEFNSIENFNDIATKEIEDIHFESNNRDKNDIIKEKFLSFSNSILTNSEPVATINDGYRALEIATKIIEKMKLMHND